MKKVREEQAEQRGPEQNADDDLANRRRLPDTVRDFATQPPGQNDDR
jgi:hypothetical protein